MCARSCCTFHAKDLHGSVRVHVHMRVRVRVRVRVACACACVEGRSHTLLAATQMLSAKKCTCYDKAGHPIKRRSAGCCKESLSAKHTVIGCAVTARHFVKALIQKKPITVKCASSCALNVDETAPGWQVYGYGPFRDDSSICKAAFVADVIGHKGGVVTLLFSGRVWLDDMWHMSLS